jgi:hypothetical protein
MLGLLLNLIIYYPHNKELMKNFFYFILTLLFLNSCASITGERVQPISVTVKDAKGNTLSDVKCTVVNDKGAYEVTAPGFVNIQRSAADISVTCKKSGYPDGLAKAISRARGNMWGTIILGGGIGAIIDHSNGKGYSYSDQMVVTMGKTTLYDKKMESNPTSKQ